MHRMIEIESCYQGVTWDERMAMCHLFGKDDGNIIITQQLPDVSLSEGPT